MTDHSLQSIKPNLPPTPIGMLQRLSAMAISPLLGRIAKKIALQHREVFDRLGPHKTSEFVIDPTDLPFALFLRPDPKALVFRAVERSNLPPHTANISGKVMTLLRLVDADIDGDAVFFSRDLVITGNTEAVVTLRNALDDVEGSVASDVADIFGAPGRFTLKKIRGVYTPSLPAME